LKKWIERFNKLKTQNKTLVEEKGVEQFKKDADIINKLNIEKSSKVKLSTEQLSKIKFNIEDKINKTENVVLKKNPNSRKTTMYNTVTKGVVPSNSNKDLDLQKFNTVQIERSIIRNKSDFMNNDKFMCNVINDEQFNFNDRKNKKIDSDDIFNNLITKNDSGSKSKSKKQNEYSDNDIDDACFLFLATIS